MMVQLRILPPAARYLKKLKDRKLKMLYQKAIDRILGDHTIGEAKNGDLAGTRENFYNQLKQYMK